MAQLVTKFGYLKDNKTRSRGGYAKYIATREGAESPGVEATWRTWPPAPEWKTGQPWPVHQRRGGRLFSPRWRGSWTVTGGRCGRSSSPCDGRTPSGWASTPPPGAGFAPLPGHHPGGGAEDPAHPSEMVRCLPQRGAPPSRPLDLLLHQARRGVPHKTGNG